MTTHPFDEALALTPQTDGRLAGATHPGYGNMVGPFGGITAALALQAVLLHPDRLGEPVALTVNFAAGLADGPFSALARPARTNRSTQHWTVELSQQDAAGVARVVTTATAVTAVRRETWSANDAPMPAVPPPDEVARAERPPVVAWIGRYEMRPICGDLPQRWDDSGSDSLSRLWLRDNPPRPLDFASLVALADVFFPRVWLRRATRVPVGTVSMTVYFHADARQLADVADSYLLGQAEGQVFGNGFFDQSGMLWDASGRPLASTHQLVYFKE